MGMKRVVQTVSVAYCNICKIKKRVDHLTPSLRCPYCRSLMAVHKKEVEVDAEFMHKQNVLAEKGRKRKRWLKDVWQ